jgi:phosphoglycerol transferase MdoB-like AlkP superfamily enzyme
MPSDDFLPQSTQRNTKKSEEQGLRPNVIAILSESFFDIQRLKNLELERDPLPFFHSIKDRARTGTLLVTPLGGGTCAVEAEFLTGVCGRFFNITKPFYYSVAKRPIPSLASHFKGLGYEARAVHTFNKTFYNREQALNNMGFDSFAGAEDFINPPKDGYYISDAFLTDKVIETFKNKKAKAFIFSISMENHQPYSPDKYPETAVKIKNGIPGRLKREAETYIHALTHADREIKRLVEFVDSQAEPTVLLYFGDHLGAIGPELAFYKEMGYINSGETTDDILALYSPDFFITCNFHNDISIKKTDYSYIGANFMAKILLDYVGGGKSEPFAAMDEAFSCVRSLSRDDVYIDGAGRPVTVLEGEALEAAEYLRMAGYRAMGYGKKG